MNAVATASQQKQKSLQKLMENLLIDTTRVCKNEKINLSRSNQVKCFYIEIQKRWINKSVFSWKIFRSILVNISIKINVKSGSY